MQGKIRNYRHLVLLLTNTLVILTANAQPPLYEKLGYFDSTVLFLLDEFEYIFYIDAAQLIPKDTLKNRILTKHKPPNYGISHLQYKIFEHTINASNVQIEVYPIEIDHNKTRFNIEIYASNAQVAGQWLSRTYEDLDLKSVYGIYDRITDKMAIHIPYRVALSFLLQWLYNESGIADMTVKYHSGSAKCQITRTRLYLPQDSENRNLIALMGKPVNAC